MIESLLVVVYTLLTMGAADVPNDATCDCIDATETESVIDDNVRREVQDEILNI